MLVNYDRPQSVRSPWRAPLLIAPILLGSAACDSAVGPETRHEAVTLNTSSPFAQRTRFVAEAGVDAGDCTDQGNPCATVGFASAQAKDGDVIDIAAGKYTEPITLDRSLTLQGAGQTET